MISFIFINAILELQYDKIFFGLYKNKNLTTPAYSPLLLFFKPFDAKNDPLALQKVALNSLL